MFFAIIAKHFQKEDKAVEEQRLERAAAAAQQVPGESQSTLEQIKALAAMVNGGMKPMGLTIQQPKCVYVCQCIYGGFLK